MKTNKQRKYAVILEHRWGFGRYLLGIVVSTSVMAAHKTAIANIKEATEYSDIKIISGDHLAVRPWRRISLGMRKSLIKSGVRF